MIKRQVISTIVDRCHSRHTRGDDTTPGAESRSPAAGGGIAGPVPETTLPKRRTVRRDPRLGQSVAAPGKRRGAGRR